MVSAFVAAKTMVESEEMLIYYKLCQTILSQRDKTNVQDVSADVSGYCNHQGFGGSFGCRWSWKQPNRMRWFWKSTPPSPWRGTYPNPWIRGDLVLPSSFFPLATPSVSTICHCLTSQISELSQKSRLPPWLTQVEEGERVREALCRTRIPSEFLHSQSETRTSSPKTAWSRLNTAEKRQSMFCIDSTNIPFLQLSFHHQVLICAY